MQRLMVGAALVAVSLALVACGGGGSEEGVPRLDGANRTGTSTTASQDPQEAMLDYAECMRRNGVDVPDPQGGGFVITPETQDTSAAGRRKFEEADKRCRHHLANMRPPKLSEEEQAQMREAALKHARCMRAHGIDVPDPDVGEGGRMAIPLDSVDLNDPDFQEAQKACEKHLRSFGPGANR